MKAYLMFPNQDLNPLQALPENASDLIQDLELNTLFTAMSGRDKFLFDISKVVLLSSVDKLETIQYRQEILKDCLNNPAIIREIYQIPMEAIEKKQRSWLGIFTHSPGAVLSSAVEIMLIYFVLLKKLKKITDNYADSFESEGFKTFFAMIKHELDNEYFSTVDYHLRQLRFNEGVLISAELGQGNEGVNHNLRLPNSKNKNWIKEVFGKKSAVYSFTISDRDEAGARALGELKDRGVNDSANALAQATEHIENFLYMLRNELAFYIGCINLKEQLEQMGNPIVFPNPTPMVTRTHSMHGIYDVCLALTKKQKIVGNNINADQKKLVMITGANQGGKSTFLRSIGLAQLMMQAGMFVPAEAFSANICKEIFTHYRRKEDSSMKSGKFDEELSRMSTIVDSISPHALMLFNESFAATNEREGSEIARQITSALLESEVKVFFVTHMYEFAHSFFEKKREDNIFLRAERGSGGKRTYKLFEGEPMQTSFGQDVFNEVFKIL